MEIAWKARRVNSLGDLVNFLASRSIISKSGGGGGDARRNETTVENFDRRRDTPATFTFHPRDNFVVPPPPPPLLRVPIDPISNLFLEGELPPWPLLPRF